MAVEPESNEDRARFVWPPGRGDVVVPPVCENASATHAVEARAASPWREIEHVWLGLQTPPLVERLAEAGWSMEAVSAACWRCGASVGVHDADDTGCSACRRTQVPWNRLVRVGTFEGVLRECVHDVKFTRWRRLGDDLGRLLARRVAAELDRVGVDRSTVGVVPVPMSFWRRLGRGIDHTRVIARGVAAGLSGAGYRVPVLAVMSKRYRPPQWAVPVGERGRNVARSMWLKRQLPERVRTLIVVDDVTTTRSTFRTACSVLRELDGDPKSGGRRMIWCAAVAVAPDANQS